jgi:glycosyltransferase involved in cell wall biosynthesis
MKVALITNIPTPYRIPLFNVLNRKLIERDLHLRVLFGSLGYARRHWSIDLTKMGFDHQILSSRKFAFNDQERTIFSYAELLGALNQHEPDVVITAGFSLATLKTCWWSHRFSRPFIIWSGTTGLSADRHSVFRRLERKALVKKADAFIAYGTKARDYLVSLGAREKEIYVAINTVDTEFFKNEVEHIRKESNYCGRPKELLFVGHLVKRKRVDHLLALVKQLSSERLDFILRIVGDGPERNHLMSLCREADLRKLVSFEGFKQRHEIPRYLASANCFLFPSQCDIWGLVLVEAMAAGVPCVSSIFCGATHDLIRNGKNGFALDFSRTEEVAVRVNWLLDNPEDSIAMGQQASRFISEHVNLEKSASGVVGAIEGCLS